MGSSIKRWLNISIWLFDGTLTGTTTPGQSGPGSNGHEGVLHIPQNFMTGATPIRCILVPYQGQTLVRVLPLCRNTVGVFYSPRWLGWITCVLWSLQICTSRRVVQKLLKRYSLLQLRKKIRAEHFCCGNTLPLLIKVKKNLNSFSFFF